MHFVAVRIWQFLILGIMLVAAFWMFQTDTKEYRVNYWLYSVVFFSLLVVNLLWPEGFLIMLFALLPFVRFLYLGVVTALVGALIVFFFVDPQKGVFRKIAAADLLLVVAVLLLSPMRGSLALFISGLIGTIVWGLIKRQSRVPFVGLLSLTMLLVIFVDILWGVL